MASAFVFSAIATVEEITAICTSGSSQKDAARNDMQDRSRCALAATKGKQARARSKIDLFIVVIVVLLLKVYRQYSSRRSSIHSTEFGLPVK